MKQSYFLISILLFLMVFSGFSQTPYNVQIKIDFANKYTRELPVNTSIITSTGEKRCVSNKKANMQNSYLIRDNCPSDKADSLFAIEIFNNGLVLCCGNITNLLTPTNDSASSILWIKIKDKFVLNKAKNKYVYAADITGIIKITAISITSYSDLVSKKILTNIDNLTKKILLYSKLNYDLTKNNSDEFNTAMSLNRIFVQEGKYDSAKLSLQSCSAENINGLPSSNQRAFYASLFDNILIENGFDSKAPLELKYEFPNNLARQIMADPSKQSDWLTLLSALQQSDLPKNAALIPNFYSVKKENDVIDQYKYIIQSIGRKESKKGF